MKNQTMKFIFAIGSLLLPTMFASANYSNGIGEVAQLHDALSRSAASTNARQPAEVRNLLAQSDCGEIFNANTAGYSCSACAQTANFNHNCSPAQLLKTVVIGEESRRYLTEEEYDLYGYSVGSIECYNRNTKEWTNSTAYVVASDLVKASAHGFFEIEDNGDGTSKKYKYRDVFTPETDCDFNIRDKKNNVTRIKFEKVLICPGHQLESSAANCDWAIGKLSKKVPPQSRPLQMLVINNQTAVGKKVFSIGHHHGVNLNGKEVDSQYKLYDSGTVRPIAADSPVAGLPRIFTYDMDTNTLSSGQPIFVWGEDGQVFVIGSHYGGTSSYQNKVGPFDSRHHYNYGEFHSKELMNALREMAPPSEKSRFETPEGNIKLRSSGTSL